MNPENDNLAVCCMAHLQYANVYMNPENDNLAVCCMAHLQYANVFQLLEELGGEWPLTPYTTSGFWSPAGT
jgi:hypothetical protein